MIVPPRRPFRVFCATVSVTSLMAALASAQPPDAPAAADSSLTPIRAVVPIGATVYVTGASPAVFKGKLAGVTDDVLTVTLKDGTRSVPAGDLRRVQWQQPDSPLNGILIGAAAGAMHGIYWLIADPNECTGLCAEDYVAIGVGAAVGGLIDRAITRRTTVYEAPATGGRSTTVALAPLVGGARKGLKIAVRF